ncbi:hypothetical protein HYT23_04220 [Candidatus Pacearchaeota archaeon]|nr:hypothetical protein [Candidatus Pacearchaeota archaeon]
MSLKKLLFNQPGNLQEFIEMAGQEGDDKKIIISETRGHEYDMGGQYHPTCRIDLTVKRRNSERNIKFNAYGFGYLTDYIEPSFKAHLKKLGGINREPIANFYVNRLNNAGFLVETVNIAE